MKTALSINNLEMSFDEFKLGPIDLKLDSGGVTGLIGPNGAGKTTMLNCVSKLLIPSSGKVTIFGNEVDHSRIDWKFDLGYVTDDPVFYENWKGQKNLEFIASFFPDWSWEYTRELEEKLECPLDKKVKSLSKGNRVKLALISVLARRPKLLLLDEPTSGLDPIAQVEFLDQLWQLLQNETTTIIYSTHNMAEISKIADEIIFLNNGNILLRDKVTNLIDNWGRISFKTDMEYDSTLVAMSGVNDGIIEITTPDRSAFLKELGANNISALQESSMTIEEIAIDIFRSRK